MKFKVRSTMIPRKRAHGANIELGSGHTPATFDDTAAATGDIAVGLYNATDQ